MGESGVQKPLDLFTGYERITGLEWLGDGGVERRRDDVAAADRIPQRRQAKTGQGAARRDVVGIVIVRRASL